MCLVDGVAKGHHVGQLQRFFDAQQLGEGGLVDGTHDAAAHLLVPSGQGHVGQGDAGVGGKVAGSGAVLQDGHIQGGRLVGLGHALFRGQIGRPLDQRLHLGHHFRALHHHKAQGLPVGPAGGQPHSFYDVIHHILRHGLLRKAAVGAAGDQRFHNRHDKTLLFRRAVPGGLFAVYYHIKYSSPAGDAQAGEKNGGS